MRNATQHLRTLIAASLLMTPLAALAGSSTVKIIANPSVKADSISAAELKSVFLEEKSSLRDGSHVEPVLARSGAAHETFIREYLGQSDSDLQTYYRTLVFTGRGSMPKEISSDSEIAAYVARTRGAIGYVNPETTTEGVKTLAVLAVENDGTRRLITRVEPVYPRELQSKNIGGTVRLRVTIAPNGSVESTELLGGNPILGESAAAAVKRWVYAAGPSRTKTEIVVPFDPSR
jgi:TonB family protein